MAYHGRAQDTRNTRTVTREQLDAARAAWDAGDFSPEWQPWRELAATSAGIIDPPDSSGSDQWGDADASDRVLLVRAIRENPNALRSALTSGEVHSWRQVVRLVVRELDRRAGEAEERAHRERMARGAEPSRAEAAAILAALEAMVAARARDDAA